MDRDKLFLLRPNFADPAYPGRLFYCWHCALIEGVLASFPDLSRDLDVVRIAWPRPRQDVIDLVGEENQSLPLLVLASGTMSEHQTGTYNGRAFIADKDAILAALSERHGFPEPIPEAGADDQHRHFPSDTSSQHMRTPECRHSAEAAYVAKSHSRSRNPSIAS